ncbi:MAG: Thivi_2564 family membrane protein [Kiritimatiellia bacterium]
MPILNVLIVLIVTGVALWAVNKFIPMARPVKSILNLIVIVVLCIWLLQEFGIISGNMNFRLR